MAVLKALEKDFEHLVSEGRLGHGYIIFGEEERLCFNLAQKFATYLETGAWKSPEMTLLDIYMIDGVQAGIDEMRTVAQFLWQKPFKSTRKTCIISSADALTLPAQHALLKIAEEPPEDAFVLLTAKDSEALIAPLASRFQKLFVSDGKGEVIEDKDSFFEAVHGLLQGQTIKERKDYIKTLFEDDAFNFHSFIGILFEVLQKDVQKNERLLRTLLKRWHYINQFNTNKKLQLEAAFLEAGY